MKVKIKKWDLIIICMLLVLSFLPYGFTKVILGDKANKVYAYITVDGEFYKEIPLTGQKSRKEFIIETDEGSNKVIVENESIAIVEADCSDHICEKFGFRSRPGDMIVCLPHRILIQIKGPSDSQTDMDARGY